jgi:hypothetical protein
MEGEAFQFCSLGFSVLQRDRRERVAKPSYARVFNVDGSQRMVRPSRRRLAVALHWFAKRPWAIVGLATDRTTG